MGRILISEEEKQRILGMHKDATKRHYLNEQTATATSNPFQNQTILRKIFDTGNGMFNRGQKKGSYMVNETPTKAYHYNYEAASNWSGGIGQGIQVWGISALKNDVPQIVVVGDLSMVEESGSSTAKVKPLNATYTNAFVPRESNSTTVWPASDDLLTPQIITQMYTNWWTTIDETRKQQIKQLVASKTDYPQEYKTLIQGLS